MIRSVPLMFVALVALGTSSAGCVTAETDETESLQESEDPLVLDLIPGAGVDPACRADLELFFEHNANYSPATCGGHLQPDPYTAQFVTRSFTDPHTGTVYLDKMPDERFKGTETCPGSPGAPCFPITQPAIVETLCNADVYYHCPCGVASIDLGGFQKAFRCKRSLFENGPPPPQLP
jgi:hypothetical protein